MKTKAYFLGSLLISIMISSTNPTSATTSDDEPLIHPDTDINKMIAKSPMSTEYNRDMLKKESSKHLEYVVKCVEKRGDKCNNEIMVEILTNKNVSEDCCRKIVSAGKDCHIAIVNLLSKSYQLKRVDGDYISTNFHIRIYTHGKLVYTKTHTDMKLRASVHTDLKLKAFVPTNLKLKAVNQYTINLKTCVIKFLDTDAFNFRSVGTDAFNFRSVCMDALNLRSVWVFVKTNFPCV